MLAAAAAGCVVCVVGCRGTGAAGPRAHEPTTLTGGAGAASTATPADGPGGNAARGALIGGAIGLSTGGLDDGSGKGTTGGAGDAAGRPRPADRSADASRGLGGSARMNSDDVVAWARQGKSDDVIIDRIERGDTVFHLTAGDETTLHARGVSDDVIRAMKQTERR